MDVLVGTYLLNPKFSDVRIKVGNECLPAHKFVLCIRSSVFAAMFNSGLQEAQTGTISIEDAEEAPIKTMLAFMYTNKVDLNGNIVMEVLYLSKKYDLGELTELCKQFLQNNISVENVLPIYSSTLRMEESDMKGLTAQCTDIISGNTSALFTSPSFLTIPQDTLSSILKLDRLTIAEVDIFRACLNWANHNCSKGQSAQEKLEPLLPLIRFPTMTISEISLDVAPSGVLPQQDLLNLLLYLGSGGKNGTTNFNRNPRTNPCAPLGGFLLSLMRVDLPKERVDLIVTTNLCLKSGFHAFRRIIIQAGGILTCDKWDGRNGGKLFLLAKRIEIERGGEINLTGVGYRGGEQGSKTTYPDQSCQGESFSGQGSATEQNNQGGGGGGKSDGSYGSIGGGGGGYGTNGQNSDPNLYQGERSGGSGGTSYGSEDLVPIFMGSGGGGGSLYNYYTGCVNGGAGGGLLILETNELECMGSIVVNGEDGCSSTADYSSGGGGGSGGSIYVKCTKMNLSGKIEARGGKGGSCVSTACPNISSRGGDGGNGRIRIDGITQLAGTVTPKPC